VLTASSAASRNFFILSPVLWVRSTHGRDQSRARSDAILAQTMNSKKRSNKEYFFV
jgi:hypothetical protein